MTTPPTPPADAVARLTAQMLDPWERVRCLPRCRSDEPMNHGECDCGSQQFVSDIRTLLAAYADAARVVDAYLADRGVRWSPGAAQMAADLLALEALRAPAPSEAVLSATDLAYVFARRLVTDGVDLSRPVKLTHEMVERAMIGVVKSYRATHPAPAPSEAVRKFSASHTRAMSELEFTHGVGVRGDAPSEAVAWQRCPVCDGHGYLGYPKGVAPGQSFFDSSTGNYPCHACNGRGALATHPAPARGVTVTEAMVERAMGVECGSTHHEHHPPDCRRCWQAKLTAALTPDAEGGA